MDNSRRLTRDNYAMFAFGFATTTYDEAERIVEAFPDDLLCQGISSYYDWSNDSTEVKGFVYWKGTDECVGLRSGSLITR